MINNYIIFLIGDASMKKLQAILESELLTDETKTALQEAVEGIKAEAIEEAKKELEVEYASKLEEKTAKATSELYSLINEAVDDEIKELKEDIQHYRNLEVDYASKLEEFKTEYAAKLQEGFEALVTESVTSEIEELKESLQEAKQENFGRKIFEAFKGTFEEFGITEDVKQLRGKLKDVQEKLSESEQKVESMEREAKMDSLLESLSGSKREVMKTILENVKTEKLEDRYNEVIAKVVTESEEPQEEVVEESANSDEVITESSDFERLRHLIRA